MANKHLGEINWGAVAFYSIPVVIIGAVTVSVFNKVLKK